jgi:hypothetical protein
MSVRIERANGSRPPADQAILNLTVASAFSRDHAPRGAFFARLADGRAPAIRPAGSV